MTREHTTHYDDCGCQSASHARAIADANAAILRLQKRLDAVRPVVAAAVVWESWPRVPQIGAIVKQQTDDLRAAVDALPAADREWAQGVDD